MAPDAQRKTFDRRSVAAPFGGTLGVIAIAFGIGVLGSYMLDLHSHICDACGHKWRHLGAFNLGDERTHTCGKCGTVQWWKDGAPHTFRTAHATLLTRPPESREVLRHALPSGTAAAWPREVPR